MPIVTYFPWDPLHSHHPSCCINSTFPIHIQTNYYCCINSNHLPLVHIQQHQSPIVPSTVFPMMTPFLFDKYLVEGLRPVLFSVCVEYLFLVSISSLTMVVLYIIWNGVILLFIDSICSLYLFKKYLHIHYQFTIS